GVDGERVKRAIEEAERATSGEIVVSVAPFFLGDVRRAAERAFDRLGLHRTRERNGVLLFVVPARRRLYILGDEGIHGKVGQEFWERIAAEVSRRLGEGDPTGALVDCVGAVGRELALHFPARPGDNPNELPDEPDM
ncbi:MAG TPA: TPM domain-containing protein, partial [Haliangiales bacterium]|nr:TPM domain-containing protein [Haliangiales bacterium]